MEREEEAAEAAAEVKAEEAAVVEVVPLAVVARAGMEAVEAGAY